VKGVTPAELAAIVHVSPETIRRHCRSGRITADMVGRSYLISEAEAAKFIESYEPYDTLTREGPGSARPGPS
jgi:excisionase family DNA binding protein